MPSLDSDISAESAQIQAESISWIPLQVGAYLHVGSQESEIIEVVGILTAEMQGLTVLLVY
jgi:hypothetical protein